ncbi:MAG: DUF4831 family protein [Paludibacter sp.]
MRKQFILSTFLVLNIFIFAQAPLMLTEGDCTAVYALPKTELCIEVQTEKVTLKQGMFYRYSERYLATNKVITENKSSYRLKSIVVKTRAVPDPNKTYTIKFGKDHLLSHVTINSQGLLCGVDVPVLEDARLPQIANIPTPEIVQPQSLLPLGEEYMMAGSEAKLAEGAAKQIYRIRESRLGLLTADVEKLPSDGASYKSMLDGMNNLERELTELFVGKVTTETQTQTLFFTPDTTTNYQVLFRLSTLRGLVSSDDLSGTPFYITVKPTIISTIAADPKAKQEKPAINTVLPAITQISIGDGVKNYFTNQFFLPQFGKIVPLPESLFKQKNIKISVDYQTGRLLSIQ